MNLIGKLLAIVLLIASTASDAASDARDQLNPTWGAVLPPAAAVDFLSAAKPADAWTPKAAQIARMETALTSKLTQELDASQCSRRGPCNRRRLATYVTDHPRRTNDYYRQYAALYYEGKPTIFILGFHRSYFRYCKPPSAPCDPHSSKFWRSKAIEVYDGGIDYFSARYDVNSNTVTAFAFHGNA